MSVGRIEDGAAIDDVPVAPGERIDAVDVLRGVALLGILLMNIEDFGLPNLGLSDVAEAGAPINPDRATWFVVSVLFEGKMRALFSMLFGAGVILLTSRAERRGDATRAADVYYRRTLWLLGFSLVHAYFIWSGDILYDYAVAGLLLFPLRKLRPRTLIAAGVLISLLTVSKGAMELRHLSHVRVEAANAAGKAPTKEQAKAVEEWKKAINDARPSAEAIAEQVALHRGGYGRLFAVRADHVVENQSREFYLDSLWDVLGMILVGMGLVKLGVFSASLPVRTYVAMAVLGFGIGFPGTYVMSRATLAGRDDPVSLIQAGLFYDPARLASALGYVGLVMLAVKSGRFTGLTSRLAAVGRMALSNYLATSVACTLLFNGYGFGLFGQLRRYQLYFIVLAVWVVQLAVSPIWLRTHRFGRWNGSGARSPTASSSR